MKAKVESDFPHERELIASLAHSFEQPLGMLSVTWPFGPEFYPTWLELLKTHSYP
jgi:hypothetical protein